MPSQTLKGYAYILLSICIWSGWIVVSRFAAKGPLSAYDVTAIRFTVSGLILLPVALRKGFSIGPWGKGGGLFLAIVMGAPYTYLAVLGMKYAPASHASTVINGTLLASTTVLGVMLLKEPTNRLRLAGVLCSLAGISLMLSAKSAYSSSEHEFLGHALFVASGMMWSLYVICVRQWHVDAFQAAATVCVLSLFFYMPPYLLFVESHISWEHWHEVAFQSVYQGVLTAVIALISFNTGVRILGASRAGAFIPLVPVLSTLLAIPVLGEMPSHWEIAGVSAVSFGVLLGSGLIRTRATLEKETIMPS